MRLTRQHLSAIETSERQFGWLVHRRIPLLRRKKRGHVYVNVTHHEAADAPFRALWYLFLTGYLWFRIYSGFYMVCATFSSTNGIPLELPPVKIEASDAVALLEGRPLVDERGGVFLDPRGEVVRILEVKAEGKLSWKRDPMDTGRLHGRHLVLVVLPMQGTTYRDIVSALDYVRELRYVDDDVFSASVYVAGMSEDGDP